MLGAWQGEGLFQGRLSSGPIGAIRNPVGTVGLRRRGQNPKLPPSGPGLPLGPLSGPGEGWPSGRQGPQHPCGCGGHRGGPAGSGGSRKVLQTWPSLPWQPGSSHRGMRPPPHFPPMHSAFRHLRAGPASPRADLPGSSLVGQPLSRKVSQVEARGFQGRDRLMSRALSFLKP